MESMMKNYINLCGQQVKLTDEQVKKLREILGISNIRLSGVEVEDTFSIGKHEFVVLEQSGDTTAAILKPVLIDKMVFGKSNNYNGSDVDAECNKFADEIEGLVGKGNLVEHTVDLTSDDGLKDYGKVRRRMSVLTTDRYRRYVAILDKYKLDKWQWLATPFSTKRHENDSWVKCVAPSGCLYGVNFSVGIGDLGVRPFCIFKSSIFVSK